ncbi:prion-like-(Q/N-rich) domain-bearing protein 25 isoform X2 [Cephus cinctus]|uniref:Prion-like-(Q/N-rich) domain-bearing protein 25 isoform X2 n=1 Tax=Cephus cinctus TaxID=211228 RepID=A0AAJ7FMB1_CEPCN|nr:prion-like-(Q/N-rich) domain-bearing protein 25 isoform X2 [Cephus cinctus]
MKGRGFNRIYLLVLLFVLLRIPCYLVSGNLTCRDQALPKTLASCEYDKDCVENAYCWNQQTCLCMTGYLVDRNRTHVQCLRTATAMGDPCTKDVQCSVTFTAQAECRDNVCQCSIGSHFQAGRCYQTVRIGQMCQTSKNCYVENSPSYCVTGFCECPFQHHPNSDGTRCIRSSFLDDQCSGDEECVAQNSRCLNVCRCNVDHVMSSDRKRCLKAANVIGESCSEHAQCQEFMTNAQCNEERCSCVEGYHQRGPVCYRSVKLGRACETHRQCVTPTNRDSNTTEVTSVDCIYGMCTCASDYTTTEDQLDCIRYSDNGTGNLQINWLALLMILASFYRF